MTEPIPEGSITEHPVSVTTTEQQEPTIETNAVEKSNEEIITSTAIEATDNNNVIDESKSEQKLVEPLLSAKESECQSKEPSSERQFQDAEKEIVENEEIEDDDDSDYEDVDDVDEEEYDEENQALAVNKPSDKTPIDADDDRINIKRRPLPKKRDEQEYADSQEDDHQQKRTDNSEKHSSRSDKKSEKNAEGVDDDNDARNPAYIPRKGKFFEHDDRTNDESEPPKQGLNRNRNRPFHDSDGKWKHDKFFNNESDAHPSSTWQKPGFSGFRRGSGRLNRGDDGRNQLHLNNYMLTSQRNRDGGNYTQQNPFYYDEENDYRRRAPPASKTRNDRTNNFDVEDYNRPSSNTRGFGRGNRGNYIEPQVPPRRQRQNIEQYQSEEQSTPPRRSKLQPTTEQSFHRERNFTNTQFHQQQQRTIPRSGNNDNNNNQRDDQKRTSGPKIEGNQEENRNRNQRRENNEPPRRQTKDNRIPPKQNELNTASSNLSAEAPSFERPKRYSNMRSNISGSNQQQQQTSQVQQPQISMQTYQDQRTNYYEQNQWQQAPPPTASYIPQQQQMMPTQMYHPQAAIPPQPYFVSQQYPQPTQYVPLNYPQGSIPPQVRQTPK